MKRNRFRLTLLTAIINITTLTAQNPSTDEGAQFLRNFYISYINTCDQVPMKYDELNQYLSESCTVELLNRIDELELDYDPFLDTQDCSKQIIPSLNVTKLENTEHGYEVTYAGYQDTIRVKLTLEISESNFRINSIIGLTDK
ncbi:MAG: DUF3828 domain-containing protein [Cyclobacteriaceae bacterium]